MPENESAFAGEVETNAWKSQIGKMVGGTGLEPVTPTVSL